MKPLPPDETRLAWLYYEDHPEVEEWLASKRREAWESGSSSTWFTAALKDGSLKREAGERFGHPILAHFVISPQFGRNPANYGKPFIDGEEYR